MVGRSRWHHLRFLAWLDRVRLMTVGDYPNEVLECQDCGRVLRRLTGSEAQRVAERPYDFVVYCEECRRARVT